MLAGLMSSMLLSSANGTNQSKLSDYCGAAPVWEPSTCHLIPKASFVVILEYDTASVRNAVQGGDSCRMTCRVRSSHTSSA